MRVEELLHEIHEGVALLDVRHVAGVLEDVPAHIGDASAKGCTARASPRRSCRRSAASARRSDGPVDDAPVLSEPTTWNSLGPFIVW